MTDGIGRRRDIWVVIRASKGRADDSGLALLSEGQRLATIAGSRVVALAFGADDAGAETLTTLAHRVIVAPDGGPLARVALAASLIEPKTTALVLTSEPDDEIAGRLAARLGAGIAAGCSSIDFDANQMLLRRPVYGGLASCTIIPERLPVVASLLPQALAAPCGSPDLHGIVEIANPVASEERLRVVGHERLGVQDLPLAESDVVVAGGLGLGGPENVGLLEELADALGGTIAGSRPVVDRGWLPPERQVGQSGAIIAPKVYVACGISGAPQHVVGMRSARTIIAINSDPGAPILKLADVPIVGDLREVLPALTAAIRSGDTPSGAQSPPASEAGR